MFVSCVHQCASCQNQGWDICKIFQVRTAKKLSPVFSCFHTVMSRLPQIAFKDNQLY